MGALRAVRDSALRKASWRLLPLLGLAYGVAYMDRINISFASLRMNQDLHFSASVYGFGAGLFFLSYAVLEVPSNWMLVRFGARRWLARIMLTWGVLAMAMMFVRTPTQFYAVRFLLGAAEAGFFPGVIYYLMQWFPADQRAQAISRFYIAGPIGGVVVAALAGPLMGLQGQLGLAGWQWMFLIEGLPALVLSAVFLAALPNRPADAAWLTGEERSWLTGAMAAESATAAGDAAHSFASAFRDPRVWLLGAIQCCLLTCAYGYIFSAPAIMQEATGLALPQIGIIMALIGLLGVPALLLAAWHSDRTSERIWHTALGFVALGLGLVILGLAYTQASVFLAYTLVILANFALNGVVWAVPSDLLKDRAAASGVAAIGAMGISGGFIGPWAMGLARDHTGDYHAGLMALSLPCLLGFILILLLPRFLHRPGSPEA